MTAQPQTSAPRPTDVNDFLMGNEDGPSAPFLKMGPAYFDRPAHTAPNQFKGGRIVALRPIQAHKLGPVDRQTGKPTRIPQFYESGRKAGQPIWDALVIVQTNERDPLVEGDDGTRQIQLDGFDRYWEATADADCRKRAARLAVTAAGATGLEVGGELYLAWVKQVPTGANPATHWVARYVPPGQSFQFEQPEQAQQTPTLGQVGQQYAQQVQQGYAQGPAPQAQQAPSNAYGPQGPGVPMAPPTQPTPSNPYGDPWAPQTPQPAPQGHTPQGQPLPAQPPF